jgi:hypothetical protein
MNTFFCVGEDELDEEDLQDYLTRLGARWLVYDYIQDKYDYGGDGSLVYWTGEGLWYIYLGHCSCYGPLDDLLESRQRILLSDLFSDDIHDIDLPDTIVAAVKALLFEDE